MKLLSNLLLSDNYPQTCKIVVAAAADLPVLKAVKQAVENKIITPVLVGDTEAIKQICDQIQFDISSFDILHEPDSQKAAYLSVKIINENKAAILMKGMLTTAALLKAVLSKDNGLRKSHVLSHFALFESPYYSKLIGITDAAMNICPSLNDKAEIIRNSVKVWHKLGNTNPKVAVIGPLETVNDKIESTIHAAKLTQMNREGSIAGCIIEGPLALDNAVSKEAAIHKGINSIVSGDADLLVVPDLNTGNALYKSLIFLGGAQTAGIIVGARVPIVLTSRSDSDYSKLLSIALAAKINQCSSSDSE